ncbi:MAG: hypothetical protein IKW96_08780 [Ruminococcus sp.]|uniref:hypothetical protein n=1 Tax=Ruminococcus sp. TaxID=41978 RepID=UPI0025EF7EBA|nr:hypothetical protein [Ruminococcus sp.]MBR5683350.1 hypothetical protein [Ruminococcus sp.]
MKALKEVLAAFTAAALLTGCNDGIVKVDPNDPKINVDGIEIDLNETEKQYETQKFTQMDFIFDTAKEVSEFGLDINSGSVTVEYSHDDKTGLALDYTVYADTEEVCQEVKDHLNAITETKGSRMDIRIVEDKTQEDITEWLKKNIPDCRVECDLYITVPEFVSSFDLKEYSGDLRLNGIKGKIKGDVTIGNISCTGSEFTGPSEITCNVGNISMSSCTYKADTDISVKTGYISYGLPLSGSDGAKIGVRTETGAIKVNGLKNYEVKNEKKKKTSHSLDIDAENCNISFKVDNGEIKIDKE